MQEKVIAIKFDHVSKEYRLGQIGGGTLKGDLQTLSARLRGKEDPNSIIGSNQAKKGDRFFALDDISFKVHKGEAIGIIGHNGAGKSTLLKLLCRVTGPTSGTIAYNGRIASMLEVGTGFHPEMTGRENIYMNGAILGMTKSEIDSKIEDIIEFSECRKFIDTPVKRYSSGMYVKLAFSVAAHLDSEIMIMDEVLAVGDMAFQKKCLDKMRDVANREGRTILYVSHNMNTIRQLCDRVIVLNHGKVVFDGDVEEGILVYTGLKPLSSSTVDLSRMPRTKTFNNNLVTMKQLKVFSDNSTFKVGSYMHALIDVQCEKEFNNVFFSVVLKDTSGTAVARFITDTPLILKCNKKNIIEFELDISIFAPGRYTINPVLAVKSELGLKENLDGLNDAYIFEIVPYYGFNRDELWNVNYNGYLVPNKMKILLQQMEL